MEMDTLRDGVETKTQRRCRNNFWKVNDWRSSWEAAGKIERDTPGKKRLREPSCHPGEGSKRSSVKGVWWPRGRGNTRWVERWLGLRWPQTGHVRTQVLPWHQQCGGHPSLLIKALCCVPGPKLLRGGSSVAPDPQVSPTLCQQEGHSNTPADDVIHMLETCQPLTYPSHCLSGQKSSSLIPKATGWHSGSLLFKASVYQGYQKFLHFEDFSGMLLQMYKWAGN